MNKILAGLEDALAYAKCDHVMVVQAIDEMPDGRSRVRSRCDKCAGIETTFYPPGHIEFVKVEKPNT